MGTTPDSGANRGEGDASASRADGPARPDGGRRQPNQPPQGGQSTYNPPDDSLYGEAPDYDQAQAGAGGAGGAAGGAAAQQPPQQGAPQGQPPQQGSEEEVIAGLTRRQVLIGGGGAVAVAGLGWFVFLRGDATDSPDSVAEAYFEALDDGDFERAAELTHPDGPERGGASVDEFAQGFEEIFQNVDITVDSTEIVNEEIPYAASDYDNVEEFETVEVESTVEGGAFGGGGSTTTTQIVVTAKDSDGEWTVWESGREPSN